MLKRFAKNFLYSPTGKRLFDGIEGTLPFLRGWHRFAYQQHFDRISTWDRLFSGVYPDFDEALREIPPGRAIGYDNPESATFLGEIVDVLPSDYPVLFWLGRLFTEFDSVFDFGGYVGLTYRAYERFNIFPADIKWTVYDVPAVVTAGRKLIVERPDPRLRFTTSLADASHSAIMLAAGSLQFCRESLAQMLAELEKMPEHLLINKLPTTDGTAFVTLHNMGPAVMPYVVSSESMFVESIERLGYQLVDRWKNAEFGCYIPTDPDRSVEAFAGFYFRKR